MRSPISITLVGASLDLVRSELDPACLHGLDRDWSGRIDAPGVNLLDDEEEIHVREPDDCRHVRDDSDYLAIQRLEESGERVLSRSHLDV